MGVLGIRPLAAGRLFLPDQLLLLDSLARQIALALEVDRLEA